MLLDPHGTGSVWPELDEGNPPVLHPLDLSIFQVHHRHDRGSV